MQFLRNNLLKIVIVLITVLLGSLCIYAILSYGNDNSNRMGANYQFSNAPKNQFNINDSKNQSDITNLQNNLNISNLKERSPGENSAQSMIKFNKYHTSNNQNARPWNRNINGSAKDSSNSNSIYSPVFMAYCILFFILFISTYLILIYKKIKIQAADAYTLIAGIFVIGFLLRIYLGLLIDGQPFDINLYKRWATAAANNLLTVYGNDSSIDYPPVYIYILCIIGKLANISLLSKYYYLLLKIPSIIADILSSYFIYRIANKRTYKELSILLGAFYIFNPAVLMNSTIWGQADSFFAFIVILSVFLLSENKLIFSSILFTVAVLMKPQGIILLPLLLFELIRRKNLKSILYCVLPALITTLIIILPFSISNGNIIWIFNLYKNTIGEYPYASDNAFNFFSLIGANMTRDTTTMFIFSYHTWGMIFIVLITLFSGFIYIKAKNRSFVYIVALIQVVGVFNFSVGMHERYMFTAVIISILAYIYAKDKRLLILSALFTLIIYINTHVVLFNQFNGSNALLYNAITILTSLLNVLGFLYLLKLSIDILGKSSAN
ncbi:MAG: hypothetical protein ABF633_16505 [Clostridium sp.]|uniref:hypothetical protein n=1 Tax=Clostridium sp. TaxID=1506 RepID=UPI0039E96659